MMPSNPMPLIPSLIKRLHVVVCFALHRERRELPCYSIFVAANSVDEAKARGDRMALLLEKHPVEEGWESHSVEAVAVPDRIVMDAALALYTSEQQAMAGPLVPAVNIPAPRSITPWSHDTLPAGDAFGVSHNPGADKMPMEFDLPTDLVPPFMAPTPLVAHDPDPVPDNALTVTGNASMAPLNIRDLPPLTGLQALVGNAKEGRIEACQPLYGDALAEARQELAKISTSGVAMPTGLNPNL